MGLKRQEVIDKALKQTEEELRERAKVAAGYWLHCSAHEQTIEDGMILAIYAQKAMERLYRMERGFPEDVPLYDSTFGDYKKCICGHNYERHFDSYEDMAPVGCKYCNCMVFAEPSAADERGKAFFEWIAKCCELMELQVGQGTVLIEDLNWFHCYVNGQTPEDAVAEWKSKGEPNKELYTNGDANSK